MNTAIVNELQVDFKRSSVNFFSSENKTRERRKYIGFRHLGLKLIYCHKRVAKYQKIKKLCGLVSYILWVTKAMGVNFHAMLFKEVQTSRQSESGRPQTCHRPLSVLDALGIVQTTTKHLFSYPCKM